MPPLCLASASLSALLPVAFPLAVEELDALPLNLGDVAVLPLLILIFAGGDIKALKVTDLTVIADYFVIVTGTSPTHIKALSDDLEDKLAEKGKNAKSVEGKATGWILLDYGTVIVHVFTKESRENFNLEKLWGDAEEVDVSEWISE